MNPLNWLEGYRTYIGAAGLLGLALYQFSVGEYAAAAESFGLALVAFGLRKAVDK